MSIVLFGSFYFDPTDVVVIDTDPLTAYRGREQKTSHYFVYLKNFSKPILLKGEAADNCLAAFLGDTTVAGEIAGEIKSARKQKETSKKGDKE